MILAVPAMADDGAVKSRMETDKQSTKDHCLLVAMSCGGHVNSEQQRIDRIQNEINRGADVYTPDELNRLRNQLEDAIRNLNDTTYIKQLSS
jgi:hypothetical protein